MFFCAQFVKFYSLLLRCVISLRLNFIVFFKRSATIKRVINLCKRVLAGKGRKQKEKLALATLEQPIVLSRDQHPISRKFISESALKVLYRLNNSGYEAYLVGGGVRDILLGLTPKDFDIATNATPEQIKALFRNCRLIGRRFRLAHIVFGREIIEVATFRGHHDNASKKQQSCKKTSKQSEQGMLLRDNIYGTIEEDAERRDFTINALYYSTKDFKVFDFANGVKDVEDKLIRLIGDPPTRYREDPVRMLRAIRFATKLDMRISDDTKAPIKELAPLMANIPAARMFEEFLKMFIAGKAVANFEQLRAYGLFGYFFPTVEQALNVQPCQHPFLLDFITLAMTNTDKRINNEQRVTPAFLFAAMLWYPFQGYIKQISCANALTPQDAFFAALSEIMPEQLRSIAIPKRFQAVIKDIWILQEKLTRREGKKAFRCFEQPKFRAGYDFLLLRAEIEHSNKELCQLASWWTDFQQVDDEARLQMIKTLRGTHVGKRRTSRKRRKPTAKTKD